MINLKKKVNILARNGRYALLDRGHEYVVACGYNGKDWTQGYYYSHWNGNRKIICLQAAIDHFRNLTEENYISRARLEELATKFKDGLIEDDRESAMEYFDYECEMTEEEKEWLGITESEDK